MPKYKRYPEICDLTRAIQVSQGANAMRGEVEPAGSWRTQIGLHHLMILAFGLA